MISGTKQRGEVRRTNRTASATSDASSIWSRAAASAQLVPGVSTSPGSSAVTWIPSLLNSLCAELPSATSAALQATYAEAFGGVSRAAIELMFTM
jgi:hypothetical protein